MISASLWKLTGGEPPPVVPLTACELSGQAIDLAYGLGAIGS